MPDTVEAATEPVVFDKARKKLAANSTIGSSPTALASIPTPAIIFVVTDPGRLGGEWSGGFGCQLQFFAERREPAVCAVVLGDHLGCRPVARGLRSVRKRDNESSHERV